MHRLAPAFALFVLVTHLMLGLRGLWHEDKNLFTMHPFSDPLLHCEVQTSSSEQLPDQLYKTVQAREFTSRMYSELIPSLSKGLQEHTQDEVSIFCQKVHL